ncbi:cell cycle transcriptional regulator TrcR [Sandaracinobacteroides sp. A072]|uniref:cell cycle transcriptional regulator TrcR n=1 Tax=Sandaracinobacteroides sp. A072 TaxID=3461146 RepID=UPI004042B759
MANPTKQAPPLMPHATATWLVDNTGLTFAQIAAFCQIHVLEVQAIADETAASKLTPRDPVRAGELTMEEIEKGQADPSYRLKIIAGPAQVRRTSGPRYTPLAKRQDKPDGIAWIIRHHPEITDGQISKLIGTTKTTIAAIRTREHWNIANITPKDPVTLGLCAQRELDALVAAAAKKAGVAPQEDSRLGADRDAMLAELKAEREAHAEEGRETPREHTAETLFRTPE